MSERVFEATVRWVCEATVTVTAGDWEEAEEKVRRQGPPWAQVQAEWDGLDFDVDIEEVEPFDSSLPGAPSHS